MTEITRNDPEITRDDDPDFGLMMLVNGEWVLERPAVLGDRLVPIRVEPEIAATRDLSPLQRTAVQQALSLPPSVLHTAAPAVLQNYEVYREAIGDEEMPPIVDPVQVWDGVTFSEIFVPSHAGRNAGIPSFLLMAECAWDPEHGLVVRFRNGVADAASQQGELWIE